MDGSLCNFIINGDFDAMLAGDPLAVINFVAMHNDAHQAEDAEDDDDIIVTAVLAACLPPQIFRPRVLGKLIERKTLADLAMTLDDFMFKRKFRVTEEVFGVISNDIEHIIDAGPPVGSRCYNSSSGKVHASIKLAMTLRYLAGGSYLDIYTEQGVSRSFFYKCVWEVLEAIVQVYPLEFPLPKEGDDQAKTRLKMDELERTAAAFKSRSTLGVLDSCVGALDGLLIRIEQPKSPVPNPARYMSRKHFFALNLQAICNADCTYTWASIAMPGSSGDRLALRHTNFGQALFNRGLPSPFYLVGDAGYEPTNWLLTPYPGRLGAGLSIEQDNFNFYQSQLRINVERSFGMLVKRFGVLWRAQTAPLDRVSLATMAMLRIHNICISFSDFADDPSLDDPGCIRVGDLSTSIAEGQRISQNDAGSRRDQVCADVQAAGLQRPTGHRVSVWQ